MLVSAALAQILAEDGHQITVATDGAEALKLLRDEQQRGGEGFDAVVSDIRMVEADGLEVLDWVVKNAVETPVLLVTAFGNVDGAVDAIRRGASDYTSKPYYVNAIKLVVSDAAGTAIEAPWRLVTAPHPPAAGGTLQAVHRPAPLASNGVTGLWHTSIVSPQDPSALLLVPADAGAARPVPLTQPAVPPAAKEAAPKPKGRVPSLIERVTGVGRARAPEPAPRPHVQPAKSATQPNAQSRYPSLVSFP